MEKRGLQQKLQSVARWGLVVVVSGVSGVGATLAFTKFQQQPQNAVQTAGVSQTVAPVDKLTDVTVGEGITKVAKADSKSVFPVVNFQSAGSQSYATSQGQLQESAVGTSVLFAKDSKYGYLITNHHVISGASKIAIVLESGKQQTADLVGSDAYTDLAVLRIPLTAVKNIPPIPFANSNQIQVGEPVVAIGTPMGLDFQDTITSGIVSGKERLMPVQDEATNTTINYQSVIQTDAAINPGNSGGPLLDLQGDMIGINSSKIVDPSVQGMGFAIPSNTVQKIAKQLLQTGHAIHPALGIEGVSLNTVPESLQPSVPVNYGVYVHTVTSKEAQAAGLTSGDVIVAVDGTTVQTMADLRAVLFELTPGKNVKLQVYRGSKKLTLTETVGTLGTAVPNTR
ncbi:S1C family serine protease [Alicyclobacillus sp. SO9]|uniref:S1C family serine protease n=1 Tax=Alicyclobacillus sp. SO9 TaxID=2665646 RepID=UPI0018E725D1|nr:trypsin-like peptidase domain-containing protein [Alicyclobacillus sp. SO9]QQE77818.1 trypsin-like peptidase domain-containing protein [Alicyclobacillus sp. SO9]